MAYNYYPGYQAYQPSYQQFQQGYQQPNYQQVQPSQQNQMQIQNCGFVSVHNEIEARNYPVAPGNSVTFIDENAPYCYTKTMGFSQLDRPKFEKYRLVKEEEMPQPTQNEKATPAEYVKKEELSILWAEVEKIKQMLSNQMPTVSKSENHKKLDNAEVSLNE